MKNEQTAVIKDMFVYGIKTLRLRRGQLQHHVNGFYLLCGRLFPNLCDDIVCDLQQSAHLQLPDTGIGHAHGIIKKRKSKRLLQQCGKLPLLRAAKFLQDRQKILLLFCQQHQSRPFPGGVRSELRYGSTSRSLSVSVMQLYMVDITYFVESLTGAFRFACSLISASCKMK